jgi:type II secretory pathway component GspD/PulD (secretin)
MTGGGVKVDGGLKIGISHANVGVFIEALEEVTDVTLLANPKVMAMNKQLGEVYIGTKLGYRDQATVSSGLATAGEVKFLDTGTKLSFRPYIGNDGYIRMDIHPKDSSGDLRVDAAGAIPDETAVELSSNIIVKDGETIVIGGLFRNKITKTKNQVPVLGNIPLVGNVFRGTSDTVERQEVIVLLTPHILDTPDAAMGHKTQRDIDRAMVGAKDSLQPIGTVKITEDSYAKAAQLYLAGDKEEAMKNLQVTLSLRPTDVEAIRLKERILSESSPEEYKKLERIIRNEVAEKVAAD